MREKESAEQTLLETKFPLHKNSKNLKNILDIENHKSIIEKRKEIVIMAEQLKKSLANATSYFYFFFQGFYFFCAGSFCCGKRLLEV